MTVCNYKNDKKNNHFLSFRFLTTVAIIIKAQITTGPREIKEKKNENNKRKIN